jgi:drug/metabolite transporter (DMT)-like permease
VYNSTILFALLALFFIGTADAINKRARQRAIPIGSYLLIQAPFFTITILIITLLHGGLKITTGDIVYAGIGVLFSFAAVTLMLHSLTHGYASVNYAIFRLSFISSAAAGIIFLHEILTIGKTVGIVLAACAIFLFFYNPKQRIVRKKSMMLAVMAMVLATCYHLTLKYATHIFSSTPSFLLLMSLFFFCLVVIYTIVTGSFTIPAATFFYAPFNGILMALGTLCGISALAQGDVSTVIPIIQLSFLITLILSITLLKERINFLQIIGIICAAVAIVLLGIL